MKTFAAKPKDVTRSWYLLDASKMNLGKLSTTAASLLIGKGKPQFSQHIDVGDFVIIVNAENLKVTGAKMTDKAYYRHSGFPGGISKRTLQEQMTRKPENVITHAVRGMLPVNKLRKARLERLKVHAGAEHGHAAQNPKAYGQEVK